MISDGVELFQAFAELAGSVGQNLESTQKRISQRIVLRSSPCTAPDNSECIRIMAQTERKK